MVKQSICWLLAGSLILMFARVPVAAAKSKAEKEAQRTEKIKAGIAQLGVGDEARVAVKLRDGRKIAGYIKEAGEVSFVIADAQTGTTTTVPYPDITQIKGHHLTKGAKIAIIALSIGVGILAFFLWLENTGWDEWQAITSVVMSLQISNWSSIRLFDVVSGSHCDQGVAIARKANGHLVDLRTQGSDLTTRLSIPETCRTVFTNSSHFFNRLFLLIDYGMVRRR